MTDSQTRTVLLFDGALTLPGVEEIQTSLLEALQGDSTVVEVDCAQAAELDVSFIQLILAARRTATVKGKSITLSGPASGVLLDALMRGGLVCAAGAQGAADDPFWFSGSKAP